MSNAAANSGPTYRQVFKHSNYMYLWLGQTISQIGDALTIVALPLLVYHLTQSAVDLTLMFVLEAIPWIIIGPIAGVFVDRMSRKWFIVMTDLVRMVLILSIFLVDSIYLYYVIAFLSQCMAAIFMPARSAAIAELVPRELYGKAIGLSYTSFQMVQVVGPFMAAGAITLLGGPREVLFLDSFTFLISALFSMMIRYPISEKKSEAADVEKPKQPSFFQSFSEGFKFLFTHRILSFITSVYVLRYVSRAFLMVGILLYIKTTFDLSVTESDRLYGFAVTSMALGTFLGVLLIGFFEKRLNTRWLIVGGLMLEGLVYLGILTNPSSMVLLGLFFVAGFMASGAVTPISVSYATHTPNEIRGRVYSVVNSVAQMSLMIGYGIAGFIGDYLGAVTLMVSAGVVLFVLTPLISMIFGFMNKNASIDSQTNAQA